MTKTITFPTGMSHIATFDLDVVVESLREAGYTVFPTKDVKTLWLEHYVDDIQLSLAKLAVRGETRREMTWQLAHAIVERLPIIESDGPTLTTRRFRAELKIILSEAQE